MKFTIYDLNGKILRICDCPETYIENQIGKDEKYIVGDFDDSLFYIVNSEAVPLPTKPSEYHVFNYSTKQWEDPRTIDTQWEVIRTERNQRLQVTDWTQLADIPQETKALWEPYRQALRDVTNQLDPFNITWPTPPQ